MDRVGQPIPAAALRVVLGDDHPMMREGLRRSLESFGLCVVADVGNGRDAVVATEKYRPDIVLLDVWMPVMDGIRATEIIRSRHPDVVVATLTFDVTDAVHARALAAGSACVITKDTEASELVSVIMSLTGAPAPTRPAAGGVGKDCELSLTSRELDVLDLIVKGASTPAIASSLYISGKTVKNHLASIYEKLDVADRTQAVLAGLRLGLVSLDKKMGQTTYEVEAGNSRSSS